MKVMSERIIKIWRFAYLYYIDFDPLWSSFQTKKAIWNVDKKIIGNIYWVSKDPYARRSK